MCGIHGFYRLRDNATLDERWLSMMGNVTQHRGPDDEGSYFDKAAGIYLGQRRLSIIDLSGGHQPIPNEDGTMWVICNGEIYNFQELRETLIQQGHRFKTGSDSEIILHLYEQVGDSFVEQLNGMFAFALWDGIKRRLLIGRDRIGIKPIYIYQDQDKLCFASEAKAILAIPGIDTQIEPTALQQYLSLGYVPAPYSIFARVKKLPPATLLVCEQGRIQQRQFWQYQARPDRSRSEATWLKDFVDVVQESVTSQMVSDVPLGAFLSGGIDSSCVVALMAKHANAPIKTYSIGFGGSKAGQFYNELPYARKIAEQFKTDHHEILVEPNVAELLPKLLWHMDEPIADSAFITTYLVAEFARKDVTVILSGVGGDELFGGYRRYLGEKYLRYFSYIPESIRKGVLLPIAKRLPADRHSPLLNLSRYARSLLLSSEQPFNERYRSYVQVFSKEAQSKLMLKQSETNFDALENAFRGATQDDLLDRLFYVDFQTQLPDDLLLLTDKSTMATSLECRVPLLDNRLIDFAMTMPSSLKIRGRTLKYIMKKALEPHLPNEILYRKKRGFGAPMGAWLKQELAPLMKNVLSKESIEKRGLFDWSTVANTIADHEANREDYTDHLQSLLNFEIWCRIYLDKTPLGDLTEQLKQAGRA